jgi:hypothetical protein
MPVQNVALKIMEYVFEVRVSGVEWSLVLRKFEWHGLSFER